MVEEVLTHDERLRLECVNQAVALNATVLGPKTAEQTVQAAKEIELYIRGDTRQVGVKSAFQG